MIARVLSIMLGTKNARELKKMLPIVQHINDLEPAMVQLSDAELSSKTNEFRKRLTQGETLDDLLPEAFAVVREAAKRCVGMRPYDVQLMGGITLHQGKIAEMKTGEGKTLTATLPLYLNALTGKGVHLVTVNDYLARRDSEWNRPIYTFLDMTVGCLQNMMDDPERKKMYECDVLYGTNSEFGFDYLRDNMKFRLEDYVQRDLNYAIVDEVDSILIDEARTPLIISGSSVEESKLYDAADRAVKRLIKDQDYEVDEKMRTVHLTESGIDKVEQALHVSNIYAADNVSVLHHVNQALKANAIFRRDVDYVVQDGEVLIVDEFTGRILAGRRYSDGLHQALEAKEGVEIERETQTLASITLQNYFRLYKKLAGMTGTAQTEAEEFYKIYTLDVVAIPTNVNMVRIDKPDLIFLSENAKFNAIISDIKERHAKGQPVLIGTVAVETSEKLSNALKRAGIPHDVLNAKQHAREAEIIQHAGEPGRVTIATNMAGRGTDIKLQADALAAGGLYILGTERHESRRIDNQLRGRSGRQGDVGESRFYIALDDDLIRRFAGETLKKNMERFGMKEDEIIESSFVSKTIERAQEKVEKQNFEVRKHLLEFDDVLNQQRIVVYGLRREILEGEENISGIIRDMILRALQDITAAYCPDRAITPAQIESVYKEISTITTIPVDTIKRSRISTANREDFTRDLGNFVVEQYALFTQSAQQEMLANVQKWTMLESLDTAWKQHMLNLDHLKEGINLRSYAQKNPLIEYKREAFAMFQDMMASLRRTIVQSIFHINIEHFNAHEIERRRERELEEMSMRGHDQSGDQEVRVAERIGRNDACPCGSGAKYKKCCGA